jgi:uncharacterized membrane protein
MSSQMQVIVAQFPGKDDASKAFKAIKSQDLKSGSVAILSKNEDGKIRVKETGDWGAGKGAVAGALAGAVLPVVGWVGGALVGAVAAKIHDGGFPNDKLKAMAHNLDADSSMFLMLTDSDLVPMVEKVLSDLGGQLDINEALTEELSMTILDAIQEEIGTKSTEQAAAK